ncbi:MAG TPA: hypothetical protein VLT58_17705, partial [Polyangia bacterium]|nr:hypothetical protein [Polyangia bacterium]
DALEQRAAALLPGLLLARVDGKSPVEYVTLESQKPAGPRVLAAFRRAAARPARAAPSAQGEPAVAARPAAAPAVLAEQVAAAPAPAPRGAPAG